jgi:hypothetical protein
MDTGAASFSRFHLTINAGANHEVVSIEVDLFKNEGLLKLRHWLDEVLLQNLAELHLQALLNRNPNAGTDSEESQMMIQLAAKVDSRNDFLGFIQSKLTSKMNNDNCGSVLLRFKTHVESYWASGTATVEKEKQFANPRLQTDLLVKRTGSSAGPFLPYEDYFFFHFQERSCSKEALALLHQNARHYVNSLYKTSPLLRYKIPNIITVIVATQDFPPDLMAFAKTDKNPWTGGEKNSVFLIDISSKTIISEDLKMIRGSYLQTIPFNRVYGDIHKLVESF